MLGFLEATWEKDWKNVLLIYSRLQFDFRSAGQER